MRNYISKRYITFFAVVLMFTSTAFAQNPQDLRLNEILVINDSNILDEYGCRGPWIEIFNSAYNTVNIGGCYLTNDRNNPTKFLLYKNSWLAKIPGRSYLLIWADNKTFRGINHANFDLRETNFLALYDSDGKTLIDSVTFNFQRPNVSYARQQDGSGNWQYCQNPTPRLTNNDYNQQTSASKILKMDPWGLGMTVIAMSIVFIVLILLYLSFKNATRYLVGFLSRAGGHGHDDENKTKNKIETTATLAEKSEQEIFAAIATALYFYKDEIHDYEPTELTIKRISRTYSPWSSKIYGLRNMPPKQSTFKK